ncbi:hypothetical protein RIR_jg21083.t1 [Rhizophagus irregularis DAOM 181602=DAOM 197198]|nr:hypothetical protein RIR_jg21083.t1 [Rhizophagus irregularis DAOM 181602=DAOM 197198]
MVQNIMRSECIYIMSIKLSFQKSPNITQGFSYISKILSSQFRIYYPSLCIQMCHTSFYIDYLVACINNLNQIS